MMHMIFNMFMGGNKRPPADPKTGKPIAPLDNYFPPSTKFDLFVHVSKTPNNSWTALTRDAELVWSLPSLTYDKSTSWRWRRSEEDIAKNSVNYTFVPTEGMLAGNESLYVTLTAFPHFLDLVPDKDVDEVEELEKHKIVNASAPLTVKMEPFSAEELQSLVGGSEFDMMEMERQNREKEKEGADEKGKKKKPKEETMHLKKRLDLRIVFDTTKHDLQSLNTGPFKAIRRHLSAGVYHPVLYPSDFWLLEKDYVPLNDTLKGEPLTVTFTWDVISAWLWSIEVQMTDTWSMQSQWGMHTRRESFMLKRIIMETNPYMLLFSALFILLHTLFSMLAFKNDIQFWYSVESMQGLSALSILISFVCEVIIGLYLLDSQDTSWLILFEIFLGIAIEGWKLTKAVKVTLHKEFPFVTFEDAKQYAESKTKEYDELAIKYMTVALSPCMIGYAIYSLYKYKFKSWYSYIISVLAGTVYTFGFIMMTPQLYINYRLKSVEHLPWKALIYKALNTFVDDIAAFIIDMPWMHRLACFRNDVIFLIYCYQRWIYRVDKTRPTAWKEGTDPNAQQANNAEGAPLLNGTAPATAADAADGDTRGEAAAAASAGADGEGATTTPSTTTPTAVPDDPTTTQGLKERKKADTG
ncbi:unnamed protein product [Vitrella brassicaformis CCMP3155]|uniref:Uncharacterized protein n=1 Tax=Vitrella brassicaformis (strain CCMP3155) TaxID=1169540 RepID=A0A0G4EI82_VITBC|nr:unnamed protein product [Vitrella brassicaformis CCMP3155]|eukprot:CEL95691.1 unnamed protein product [Vitrella brassicaformis CCMP3155]